MRLFTAVDLPAAIVARLEAFQLPLKALARLSWSPAENFHITTKFMGEIEEDAVPAIQEALRSMPPRQPIPVTVRGFGFFPNAGAPRIFWAGVEAPAALGGLHTDTDRAVAAAGVKPEEKPFRPHLTLARIRDRQPLDALHAAIAGVDAEFGHFTADRQFLYLSRDGRYIKLTEHLFAA